MMRRLPLTLPIAAVAGFVLASATATAGPAAGLLPERAPGSASVVRVQATTAAPSQQQQAARVNVKSAVLRASPDTKGKKLASLRRGTHVEILDSTGDWAHVRAGKREGYVLKSLLATGG